MDKLTDEALVYVADYFHALAAPARLQILHALRLEELSVGALAKLCGCSSANVSRHLAVLVTQGLVARTARGTSAYYRIGDPSVRDLCELVCKNIARNLDQAASAARTLNKQGEQS